MVTAHVPLAERLPDGHRECRRCLDRLMTSMREVSGVVEVRANSTGIDATVVFDADRTSLVDIEAACQSVARAGCDIYAQRTIPIEGMTCDDCAAKLENAVARLDGVNTVTVNFIAARMDLEYRDDLLDDQTIARRVAEVGYRVSEDDADDAADTGALRSFLLEPALRPTLVGVGLTLLGIVALILGASELTSTGFFALAAVIAGVPVARSGINGLRINRQLDINMLMTIAVIGAAILGEWLEAATVVVLFSIGEALEGFAMDRARRSIRGLMSLTPDEATVRRAGAESTLPVAEIVPGDVVIVRPGGRLPVDGIIRNGSTALDQSPVTGESIPVDRGVGDEVFSGTINGSGVIEVEATQPASNSTIARIVHMVEEAQARRAPAQRFIDLFARYYTPSVVLAATLVALAPPLALGGSWSEWFYRALILLVVACPCALVISTPVSIVSAIAASARNGVLIKGGAYLEALGSLRALAFDKTGTLTQGKPEVQQVIPLNGRDEGSILRLAALAERYSEHPLGDAIVRSTELRGVDVSAAEVSDVVTTTGSGISARVDGQVVEVGSRRILENGRLTSEIESQLLALERQGQTAVIVKVDGTPEGVIGLADTIRPEAREALAEIHAAGIERTVMLTGDRADVAAVIAQEVGIDEVEAELLPDQKVGAVARLLERHEQVGMVGDGVNDAPALARSTVGIAMGAVGTDTALETADVALMGDDLGKLAGVVRLSRRTKRIIIQNIALALAIKGVVLLLAVAGLATLWQAIFADVGATLIVVLNGLRLLRQR